MSLIQMKETMEMAVKSLTIDIYRQNKSAMDVRDYKLK